MIIGIVGLKGHGKDAVGKFIKEYGFKQIAFADALKEATKIIFRLTDEQVYGDIVIKETVDERFGLTPRHLIQSLGMWARAEYENVWVDNVFHQLDLAPDTDWVITDVRFLNEAYDIRERGGIIIRVERTGVDTGEFEDHPSEQEQRQIRHDFLIENNGTLDDLKQKVHQLMAEVNSEER